MKIEIKPTGIFEGVNGVRCRIWEGVTDQGVEVRLFIPMVRVRRDADNAAFERELSEVKVSRELAYFDHRLAID